MPERKSLQRQQLRHTIGLCMSQRCRHQFSVEAELRAEKMPIEVFPRRILRRLRLAV